MSILRLPAELQRKTERPPFIQRVRDRAEIRIGQLKTWLGKLRRIEKIVGLSAEGQPQIVFETPGARECRVDVVNRPFAKDVASQIAARFGRFHKSKSRTWQQRF